VKIESEILPILTMQILCLEVDKNMRLLTSDFGQQCLFVETAVKSDHEMKPI